MHHTDLPQLLDRWRRHFSFEIYEYVIFYCLRRVFPGDMFGVNPADEVEGLLFIYCKFQADQKPGKYQASVLFYERPYILCEDNIYIICMKF